MAAEVKHEPVLSTYKSPIPGETDMVMYFNDGIPNGTLAFVMNVQELNTVLFVPRLNGQRTCYHRTNPQLIGNNPGAKQQRSRGWWDFAPSRCAPLSADAEQRLSAMEKVIAALVAKIDAVDKRKRGRPSKKTTKAEAKREKILAAAAVKQE